jgi:glycosyltransferase involved in cell wall biosynthesis
MNSPLVSICIPTYNQPQFVKRGLNSILNQDYQFIEVIISDDSPNEDIKEVIASFQNKISVKYFSNKPALKSPENWNNALDKANGELLLLLHQDDWLHASDALSTYVAAFTNPEISLVFGRNTAVDEQDKIMTLQNNRKLIYRLDRKASHLLLSQVIGPPSNLMFRNNMSLRFDRGLIWLVDVDIYIRMFEKGLKYHYIDRHLVSIGLHKDQATIYCLNHPEIIFRENVILANKLGDKPFCDIVFFDYYWRLLRNYKIRALEDIKKLNLNDDFVPYVLREMLKFQTKIPSKILNIGVFSKILMSSCFLIWRLRALAKQLSK